MASVAGLEQSGERRVVLEALPVECRAVREAGLEEAGLEEAER